MNENVHELLDPARVRDNFVPKEGYFDPEFNRLEYEHLWPKVWQVACRLEEIPNVGDYVTYDIGRDSITVLRRSEDVVRAFFNSCQHRGRRLTDGCGKMKRFQCRFHGWKYNLDGKCIEVLDRKDWADQLRDEDVDLVPVSVDTWGGFVFINMEPNPEPLSEYLKPFNELLANFELEKMRYRWYKTVRLNCNWKTVLEAFDEGYHAAQTHPQLLPYFDDYTGSAAFGRHGAFFYPQQYPPLQQSKRLKKAPPKEYRKIVMDYTTAFDRDLGAMVTPRSHQAAQRLKDEVAPDADATEVLTKWAEWTVQAAHDEGAGWPNLTLEEIQKVPADIHLFPNSVFLPGNVDGLLWYRARPDGSNPESCIFDIWSLVRYAPGAEPPLKREFYENWQDNDNWGLVLTQDFRNIEEVQRGMAVRSYKGGRTNPVQELAVSNFERTVREYLARGIAETD